MSAPARWGEYEALDRIGAGSSSQVYRTRGPQGEALALKIARDALQPEDLARFEREGQLAAELQDPGLVRVHDWGTQDGVPYVVYELIEGEPLERAWTTWPRERRVEVVREVSATLARAHAQGVVHRDLKPANVLVDAEGRARVADFGLSWRADLETLTQSRAILGTPLYMAPEVWSAPGKAARRSPAVDVWSLGVLLYEALTGRHPYGGPQDAPLDLLRQLQRPLVSPRALQPEVPAGLEAVCLRALARDPAQRFRDAGELLEALDQAPTQAHARTWPWLVAAALAALGLAVALWGPAGRDPELAAPTPTPSLRPPRPAPSPSPSPGPSPSAATTPTPAPASPTPAPLPEDALPPAGNLRSLTPNPMPARPGQPGHARLAWSTVRSARTPSVWVSVDGGPETLFSRAHAHEEDANWIVAGKRYRFRLYAGPDAAWPLLDEVVIEGISAEAPPAATPR